MKRANLVCLLALLVCMGCKREKPEAETVEEPVEVPQAVGGTDAVSRIKALYEGLFAHYNKGDFDYDVQSAFSSRLRGIWSQLPENELVYSSNIWTDLQDFDSLVLEMVTLENGTQIAFDPYDGFSSEVIKELMNDGYNGYLAIEHFDVEGQEDCMRGSAEFLRSLK